MRNNWNLVRKRLGFRLRGGASMFPHLNINVSKEIMMSDNKTPVDNDNTKRGTVSIRNMELQTWYKASYLCKLRGERLSEFIGRLIEMEFEDYENASNQR